MVNFNPYYRVYDPDSAILGKKYASNIYEITCPVDVLSSDIEVSNAVRNKIYVFSYFYLSNFE